MGGYFAHGYKLKYKMSYIIAILALLSLFAIYKLIRVMIINTDNEKLLGNYAAIITFIIYLWVMYGCSRMEGMI